VPLYARCSLGTLPRKDCQVRPRSIILSVAEHGLRAGRSATDGAGVGGRACRCWGSATDALLGHHLGVRWEAADARITGLPASSSDEPDSPSFAGLGKNALEVWMSHKATESSVPGCFVVLAHSANASPVGRKADGDGGLPTGSGSTARGGAHAHGAKKSWRTFATRSAAVTATGRRARSSTKAMHAFATGGTGHVSCSHLGGRRFDRRGHTASPARRRPSSQRSLWTMGCCAMGEAGREQARLFSVTR